MNYPGISIVIAVLNEDVFISKCLNSLINQTYQGDTEILIADGGSDDNTIGIISEYQQKHSNIKLFHNDKKNQAAGRNLCVKNSKYDLIAYIDGHSFADDNWLEILHSTFAEFSDDILFGVGSVYVNSNKNSFAKSTQAVLKSILAGAGDEHFLNVKNISETDNAYACLYKKSIFNELGGYKEYLLTGEDIELNQRAVSSGYKLLVNPNAKTYYKRQANLAGFIKQQYRYGYWRALLIKKSKFSIKPLTPSLFIVFFIIGLILAFTDEFIYEAFNYAVLFYLVFVFYYSAKIGIRDKLSSFLCFLITISLHFSYGTGMLIGLIFNNKDE